MARQTDSFEIEAEDGTRFRVYEYTETIPAGTFGNPGEPARDISYRVQVHADAPKATIDDLIRSTDSLTEIQNTLRAGCAVRLMLG